jgi:hypothetical protein
MHRWGIAVIVGMLAVAGCGDDEGDAAVVGITNEFASLPQCSTWDNKVVTAEQWEKGCKDGDSWMLAAPEACKDGSMLYWNDWGWGYAGKTARKHAAGAPEKVAPRAELDACEGR